LRIFNSYNSVYCYNVSTVHEPFSIFEFVVQVTSTIEIYFKQSLKLLLDSTGSTTKSPPDGYCQVPRVLLASLLFIS
jgi:hypothetical protein